MQVLRDVMIITFQMVIAFHYTLSSGCVKPGARHAIIQASQQLGYATIRPDQNRAIKSFMEGRDLACRRGLESRYASLCYPTRSITQSTNALVVSSWSFHP